MDRCLAFFFALLCASLTVSSACVAQPTDWVGFTLEPERGDPGKLHASFRDVERDRDRNRNSWSTGFEPAHLIGLDVAGFRAAGTRPLRFAIVREAGRLDCAGNGGSSYARGNCRFTADPRFTQLLISHGIGRPTREQSFGLMAVDARSELIDAVAAAHYPTPEIDDLMALSALGVNGAYVNAMASAGYRPRTVDTLVQFKALGITPQWISGFVRIGYANMDTDDLVQLRALGITPEFIAGFERIGYRNLPVDTLVQLKALDITPEFVRAVEPRGGAMPPVQDLVELKIFGRRR